MDMLWSGDFPSYIVEGCRNARLACGRVSHYFDVGDYVKNIFFFFYC